jgi:LysR family transcriptional regulator, glycine cleavage system transcriptional activator
MIGKRLHPPTQLLRAFVTVARLQTVSAAAVALHLTQGAVSKQIRELEDWLRVPLFERVRKRLQLTPAGARYLGAVEPLLAQLEAATLDLMSGPPDDGVLHLSVLPTFGAKWLIPRLSTFQAAHPRALLQFVPYVQGYDFTRPDLDCAIRYGEGPWPGTIAEPVTGREMALIAAPRRAGDPPLRRPSDIADYRLLQHATVPRAWSQWCERQGVAGVNPHSGIQLDQYGAIVRAVSAGLGIGLVPTCLIEDELARGEVIEPLAAGVGRFEADAGYVLCYPEHKASLPALLAFRGWLREAVEAGATRMHAGGSADRPADPPGAGPSRPRVGRGPQRR